jgi:hypothetical protein
LQQNYELRENAVEAHQQLLRREGEINDLAQDVRELKKQLEDRAVESAERDAKLVALSEVRPERSANHRLPVSPACSGLVCSTHRRFKPELEKDREKKQEVRYIYSTCTCTPCMAERGFRGCPKLSHRVVLFKLHRPLNRFKGP